MIRYKVDVIKEMSKYSYNQYKIQKEKLLLGQTIANIRAGKSITLETLKWR